MNTVVKVGLIAGGAYVAYEMGWLSVFGLSPLVADPAVRATNVAATIVPPGAPPPATPANTLDGLYAKLVATANAPAAGLAVDDWGFFLNQVLATAKLGSAPDPIPIFSPDVSQTDRSKLFTASDYWAKMAPALKTQYGLSGLGPRGLGWMAGWR